MAGVHGQHVCQTQLCARCSRSSPQRVRLAVDCGSQQVLPSLSVDVWLDCALLQLLQAAAPALSEKLPSAQRRQDLPSDEKVPGRQLRHLPSMGCWPGLQVGGHSRTGACIERNSCLLASHHQHFAVKQG